MTYATKQNMIDRFGDVELMQLTDRTGAVDTIDDTVLNKALADADEEINGYLVGRYPLPLTSAPKVLEQYACDIARYKLYKDRPTEQVTKRYDDAVKFLRSVAKGEISLGMDAQQVVAPTSGGPKATTDETSRVFTRDSLADY